MATRTRDLSKFERLAVLIALIGGLIAVAASQFIIAGIAAGVGFLMFVAQSQVDQRQITRLEWIGITIAVVAGGTYLLHHSVLLSLGGIALGFIPWLVQKDMKYLNARA
jgi:hypothetical protein